MTRHRRITLIPLILLLLPALVCGCAADTPTVSTTPTWGTAAGVWPTDAPTSAATTTTTTAAVTTTTTTTAVTTTTTRWVDTPDIPAYPDKLLPSIPATLKGSTVVLADDGRFQSEDCQAVIRRFQKDAGIQVKTQVFTNADKGYVHKVAQEIAAGRAPDVVFCNGSFPWALEITQPLPAIFNVNDGFWNPQVTAATRVGGKSYFVNSCDTPYAGGYVVYYNKSIFSNNGLYSPQDYLDEGRWSYEKLLVCLQEAVQAGYKGGILDRRMLAEQQGTFLVNYDPNASAFSANVTDDRLVKALQFMATATDNGWAVDVGAEAFAAGDVGLYLTDVSGLFYNGFLKDVKLTNFGVAPLPDTFGGQKLTHMPVPMYGFGIAKRAGNADGAYYFLRYFLDLYRYEASGVELFVNKVMEKYYRRTHMSLYLNTPLYYQHYLTAFRAMGKPWTGDDWTRLRHASASAVAEELEKQQSVATEAAAILQSALP
ncbi:MAG: extracellular solute-binding protein [Ruminococcaceae bacterium]|nr:extracellular solute-binding protein [Oscillospiraceae bacterium]